MIDPIFARIDTLFNKLSATERRLRRAEFINALPSLEYLTLQRQPNGFEEAYQRHLASTFAGEMDQ